MKQPQAYSLAWRCGFILLILLRAVCAASNLVAWMLSQSTGLTQHEFAGIGITVDWFMIRDTSLGIVFAQMLILGVYLALAPFRVLTRVISILICLVADHGWSLESTGSDCRAIVAGGWLVDRAAIDGLSNDQTWFRKAIC